MTKSAVQMINENKLDKPLLILTLLLVIFAVASCDTATKKPVSCEITPEKGARMNEILTQCIIRMVAGRQEYFDTQYQACAVAARVLVCNPIYEIEP